jgi:hypothetical protein
LWWARTAPFGTSGRYANGTLLAGQRGHASQDLKGDISAAAENGGWRALTFTNATE